MKFFALLLLASALALRSAFADEPVTLTIEPQPNGYEIPADFAGVSIFTGTQTRDHKGMPGNLFSGTNTQLITIFENAGLHHLRLGATGSPNSGSPNLPHEDIDALFAFARAAGIKVIYSLHYADGPATAKYVWDNYRPNLDYFAFDNEPDGRLKEDSGRAGGDYFITWREFAASVVATVPGAKFAGPDAAGRTLVKRFVKAEKDSGNLALVTQHTYVGGNSMKRGIDVPHAIESMLSVEWVTNNYPQLYRSVLEPVQKQGLPFRITELDDHVHGVTNASDSFASALWALDVMHWWAAHGAAGVNFQNTEWLRTDTFYLDTNRNYQMYPKGYGIRAFELGSHGRVATTEIENPKSLNLTAYAVADSTNLFVTVINKEHGIGARGAEVKIRAKNFVAATAGLMILKSATDDAGATNGITLGGTSMSNDKLWEGKWSALETSTNGCTVKVPATTAAVIRISAR